MSSAAPASLAATVRSHLLAKRLPFATPWRRSGEYGDGSICDVCGQRITSAQASIEVDFLPEALMPSLRFHRPCFDAWQSEREALSQSQPRA